MFGVVIAISTVCAIVILTMFRRDLPLLMLMAIFILTVELGEGFTSFQGSIFFNQNFLDLAKLKLVEVILYSYTVILLLIDLRNQRKLKSSSIRRLYWFWLAWLLVLLFVQFFTRGSIDLIAFRGIYFGWALLYVFSSVIDSRIMMGRVVSFTLVLIVVKALWLMFMFAIGQGDHTSRGYSPIFWDDKLLEAFTWALLVLLVSILQSRTPKSSNWPAGWVLASLVVIALVIALSLRRNYLGQVAVGCLFVLFSRGHWIQPQRFFTLAIMGAILLGLLFTAGQVIGDRLPLIHQLTEYVQLLNFTSTTAFTSKAENQVHLFNVETYYTLLYENEGIRLFGRSAAPTDNFRNFNREYLSELGLAHNGPLRAIFDYGVGGLVVWVGFFYLTYRAYRRCCFAQLNEWERVLMVGSAATIFSHFIVTLTVIPPFFTTLKIFFIFLFIVYIIVFYSRESQTTRDKSEAEMVERQSEWVNLKQPTIPAQLPDQIS